MIETNELLIALIVLNIIMLKMYPKNYVMQILFGLGIPIFILSNEIIGWFHLLLLIWAIVVNAMGLFFNSMKRSN